MNTLNEQQQQAVTAEDKKILCLAGAGAGKTRTVIERISYLINEKHVSPHEILAITFTRKAANELKQRLDRTVGPAAVNVDAQTIHSFCLHMFYRFGDFLGFRNPRTITVYDPWEENYLLRHVAAVLGIYKNKKWIVPKKQVSAAFERYYQEGIEPDLNDKAYGLFVAFFRRCKENNALTYGEIVVLGSRLIPLCARYLPYLHIFLDEAQDTDRLQWKIINELHMFCDASLFAVGDPDQSIYSFRGAIPEYLIENQDSFKIIKLETNYRSSYQIVDTSNLLIQNNTGRLEKTMKAIKTLADAEVRIVYNADSAAMVKHLKHASEHSAVLCRIHQPLNKLSEMLVQAGIQHDKVGARTEFVHSETFRRFNAFLKLMHNPYDNFSFLLVHDMLDMTQEEYTGVRLRAVKESLSHFQAYTLMDDPEIKNSLFDWLHELSPLEITEALISQWGPFYGCEALYDFVLEADVDEISDYLHFVATWDIQDEIEGPEEDQDEENKLQLMTIHASKGLEFKTVYVIGCNEGILPHKNSLEQLEEERRCMYVAMTRAERRLYLCVRPTITESADGGKDRVYDNPASRFVFEAHGIEETQKEAKSA